MQPCQAKAKTGAACRAAASAGGPFFFHANPDSAKRLGQLGGRKNRRTGVDLQIRDNATTADLRNLTLQAIRLLFSGDMHPREAGALAQLCNSLYRVMPAADLETRVALLEERILQSESGPSLDGDPSGAPRTNGTEVVEANVPFEQEAEVSLSSVDAGEPSRVEEESTNYGFCEGEEPEQL